MLKRNYKMGPHVLVVEDVEIAAKMAEMVLTSKNCVVDIATTGKAALEKSKKKYDLILLDIGLPDIDGYTVAEKIRNRHNSNKDTIIIALTAHSDTKHVGHSKDTGINELIEKPLTLEKCEYLLEKYYSK